MYIFCCLDHLEGQHAEIDMITNVFLLFALCLGRCLVCALTTNSFKIMSKKVREGVGYLRAVLKKGEGAA